MELLESDDPKSKLVKKAALHRYAMEDEARLITARTEKVITNALIIGASLAATFFLVKQLSGKRSKIKSKKLKVAPTDDAIDEENEAHVPSIVNQIGAVLASQATSFLLDLAREKLSEYLQRSAQKETKD
jgi:plasmid stability protein